MNSAASPPEGLEGVRREMERDATGDMQELHVACATDERYAVPLAVTIRTAAAHLRPGSRIVLHLLDGGITELTRQHLLEAWTGLPVEVHRIVPNRHAVSDLMTSHHISPVAYYRILLPEVLPQHLDRVLYLDCDLLIRDDLSRLWELPFRQDWCLAVPDIACPRIDARRGMLNFRKASPYLASLRPVANYRQFGIDSAAPYFNSGLLLINLDAWRHAALSQRMLQVLREHRQFIWCWDQYALNVQLAGRWRPLPVRWNLGTHAFEYPTIEHAPVDPEEFADALADPAIVHFTTEHKPWHYGVSHPYRDSFFAELQQTPWRDWQPTRPAFELKPWWDGRAAVIQKQAIIALRKLTCW